MCTEMLKISCKINDKECILETSPQERLADILRDELQLTGTKIGCNAGDCGACTVLIDGRQMCACLVPVGRLDDCEITTIEGLSKTPLGERLQRSFHDRGAAQCGICTPGMLMAAMDLLGQVESPNEEEIAVALGGVLCRCTGYRKIIEAVHQAAHPDRAVQQVEAEFGQPIARLDGWAKVTGVDKFAADNPPSDALHLRIVRSPYVHARFELGGLESFQRNHPAVHAIITAKDIPGRNSFGIYPDIKDQPVLADGYIRHRGEPVLALVGNRDQISAIDETEIPIIYSELPEIRTVEDAVSPRSDLLHSERDRNILISGRVVMGEVGQSLEQSFAIATSELSTSFVEHAYIEPEAGFAERIGDRIEITACTQAPYMDREEIASVLGIMQENVRVIPSACGGGFGGKLDVAIQPILAVAAWLTNRPVAGVFTRPESMSCSTKRHPAKMKGELGADCDGKLTGIRFHGDFATGAYASWGPTVATRVPVHATGPYVVRASNCTSRAIFTNDPPAGAFRGFGVPQVALVHEQMMDKLADQLGIDRLEFRFQNAMRPGDKTHFGQQIVNSVELASCLDQLRPIWLREKQYCTEQRTSPKAPTRKGIGVACMWYGLGNTSMSNPAEMDVTLSRHGRLTLHNGAVDIGQGSATVMVQICAKALGLPVEQFNQVLGDTDRTKDAGKTSASRQTLISGNAARLAGEDLRRQILRLANAGQDAELELCGRMLLIREGTRRTQLDLDRLASSDGEIVLIGSGYWDPPAGPLDQDGQGTPYASYGFGAQIARVDVDPELGTVKVEKIWAAHDVGRPVNPMLVEGQIEGGIAQGIGLALMEEFISGVNENLHDYLIPTIGDVPPIEITLVEGDEPLGPFGAKGVGEPALIPTAPAIFGAINDAVGVWPTKVPFTPDRLRSAILEKNRQA